MRPCRTRPFPAFFLQAHIELVFLEIMMNLNQKGMVAVLFTMFFTLQRKGDCKKVTADLLLRLWTCFFTLIRTMRFKKFCLHRGYQGMFAVITPALMTGAFADRFRFKPYLIFIAVWLDSWKVLIAFTWNLHAKDNQKVQQLT